MEQSRGDECHNLVCIVMNQYGFRLTEAFCWIGKLHDELVALFLDAYEGLPYSNVKMHHYASGIGNWVRANDSWSFESERYFGKHGKFIQASRVVQLLSKTHS